MKKAVNFPVTQYQFDALVSLDYNAGDPISVITKSLAAGNLKQAEKDWFSRTYSKGRKYEGLVKRGQREVNLYEHAIYN